MNINGRITNIERLLSTLNGGPLPERIPEHWCKRDPITGEWLGPKPGEDITDGQRLTLETTRAMIDSVPFCAPATG